MAISWQGVILENGQGREGGEEKSNKRDGAEGPSRK